MAAIQSISCATSTDSTRCGGSNNTNSSNSNSNNNSRNKKSSSSYRKDLKSSLSTSYPDPTGIVEDKDQDDHNIQICLAPCIKASIVNNTLDSKLNSEDVDEQQSIKSKAIKLLSNISGTNEGSLDHNLLNSGDIKIIDSYFKTIVPLLDDTLSCYLKSCLVNNNNNTPKPIILKNELEYSSFKKIGTGTTPTPVPKDNQILIINRTHQDLSIVDYDGHTFATIKKNQHFKIINTSEHQPLVITTTHFNNNIIYPIQQHNIIEFDFNQSKGLYTTTDKSNELTIYRYNQSLIRLYKIGYGVFGDVYNTIYLNKDPISTTTSIDHIAVKAFKGPHQYNDNIELDIDQMSKLDHINVVKVYPYGLDSQTSIMVMELYQETLKDLLLKQHQSPPLTFHQIILFLLGIARGMEYLHSCNVVHLDLKPSNIGMDVMKGDSSDRVKIIDFGTSQVLDASNQLIPFQKVGTPFFMAPEISKELNSQFNGMAADVYSFGVTMLYCIMVFIGQHNKFAKESVHQLILSLTCPLLKPKSKCSNCDIHLVSHKCECEPSGDSKSCVFSGKDHSTCEYRLNVANIQNCEGLHCDECHSTLCSTCSLIRGIIFKCVDYEVKDRISFTALVPLLNQLSGLI